VLPLPIVLLLPAQLVLLLLPVQLVLLMPAAVALLLLLPVQLVLVSRLMQLVLLLLAAVGLLLLLPVQLSLRRAMQLVLRWARCPAASCCWHLMRRQLPAAPRTRRSRRHAARNSDPIGAGDLGASPPRAHAARPSGPR
jgi:hypothetical protein